MKLKRYKNDINESSGVMYFADKKPKMSEENEKFEIIEKLSQHWNQKLKNDFLVPRSLYNYTLDELKKIEKFYLNESNEYCDFGCNYISKFIEEHPEYDKEEFFEYVANHNMADRDIGELQDIKKEEIERLAKEWKPVKESVEDLQRIADLTGGEVDRTKPSIFQYTIYRLPTEEELKEFAEFPNLTAKEIENGFGYTIIGRGIASAKNKQMIIDSIQMLIDMYPENEEYKKALDIAKGQPIWNPKLVEALHELKQQHSTNEAVEDIRIEDGEIVFDVKCETDVQSVTEYNGFQLRFNHLCNINEHVEKIEDEKSEDEIIEHARMIKEQVISEYLNDLKDKLFESPDNITTIDPDNKKTTYSSYDSYKVAKPFAFTLKLTGKQKNVPAKKDLKPGNINELWIGDFAEGHSSDCPFFYNNGGEYAYDDCFLGRLWFKTAEKTDKPSYDLKILSFWIDISKNTALLQHIVSEIERTGLDLSDWYYDNGYKYVDVGDVDVKISDLIPLKELNITFLSEEEKTGANIFKKVMKKRTPLMYRQAIYGENKTYNFEEFLKLKK